MFLNNTANTLDFDYIREQELNDLLNHELNENDSFYSAVIFSFLIVTGNWRKNSQSVHLLFYFF